MTREDSITEWFAEQSRLDASIFPIGIGDDMAQVNVAGKTVLITTDMLLDGVHFNVAECGFFAAGRKAMAVNLSDCAAMASEPLAAAASVGLCAGTGEKELKEIHEGLTGIGEKYNCKLIGGDINVWSGPSGKLVINVCVLSTPGKGGVIRRNGAKAGDIVCVTGTLGDSLASGRHLSFEPRVKEAIALASAVRINSMMDISDGLNRDIRRICRQSGAGAVLYARQIENISNAKSGGARKAVLSALNDGEDFELLFTLNAGEWEKLQEKWDGEPAVTAVGRIEAGSDVTIDWGGGRKEILEAGGYDHLGRA